jgi:hypothetical protein
MVDKPNKPKKKVYSNEHPKYKTLYNVGVGFTNTTDSFHDSGGKTITGSDIKDLIENPADDKPTLKITRSTGKFEKDSLGYVPDPTKGQISVEIGKDNLGLGFRKTFFQKGAKRKRKDD